MVNLKFPEVVAFFTGSGLVATGAVMTAALPAADVAEDPAAVPPRAARNSGLFSCSGKERAEVQGQPFKRGFQERHRR